MGVLTKQSQVSETVLNYYIFDIFAKYKPVLLKQQLLQISDLFMDCSQAQLQNLQ